MIYVPDLNYKCYVVQSEGVIRAYEERPQYNTEVNYRDYYINSSYIYKDGYQSFGSYSTIPTCLDTSVLTNDFYYRLDLDSSYPAFMRSLFINGYYCKPMVYVPNGNVYFGESIFCKPVDNIYNHLKLPENAQLQSIKDWWEKMKKGYTCCNACNACKNVDPSFIEYFKEFNFLFSEFDEKTSTNNLKQIHTSDNFETQ